MNYLADSVTLGGNTPKAPLKLEDLICESEKSDSPDDVLYRFVSACRAGYEVEGCEEGAVCLLVNFSVRRDFVEAPLDREEAIDHLREKSFQLIKRYKDSLRGYHTHNAKFPLSFLRANIFYDLPYDENDPYVHSGSVKLNKRHGYAQNAANIKAAKALLAEFYYKGVRTSMIEELQHGGILSRLFLGFLEEGVERSGKPSDQYDEKAQCIEDLLDAVDELSEEAIPEVATDPQVFAYTRDGEPELLLSPVVNTGLQNEINLRLADYDWWLGAAIHTGTGKDINTYGSLLSDSGGYLRVLRSLTPVEKKGEFRLLIDQLSLAGHLYDFTRLSPRILSIGQSYVDNETGQVRRWSRFEQQKAVKVECRKIVRALFSHYRKLNFYLGLGRKVPKWCRNLLEQSAAQLHLIDGDTKTSANQKVIIEEIKPLLIDHLASLANENDLPFVEYHQKVIEDAIRDYLQSS